MTCNFELMCAAESFHKSHLVVVLRIFGRWLHFQGARRQAKLLRFFELSGTRHGSPGGNITVRVGALMAFHALVERCGFGHDKFTSRRRTCRFLNGIFGHE